MSLANRSSWLVLAVLIAAEASCTTTKVESSAPPPDAGSSSSPAASERHGPGQQPPVDAGRIEQDGGLPSGASSKRHSLPWGLVGVLRADPSRVAAGDLPQQEAITRKKKLDGA